MSDLAPGAVVDKVRTAVGGCTSLLARIVTLLSVDRWLEYCWIGYRNIAGDDIADALTASLWSLGAWRIIRERVWISEVRNDHRRQRTPQAVHDGTERPVTVALSVPSNAIIGKFDQDAQAVQCFRVITQLSNIKEC